MPTAGPQVGPGGLEHGSFQLQPKTLTQDSFMTQQQPPQMPQQSEDDDDLPPPPPPLSSSPTPGNAKFFLAFLKEFHIVLKKKRNIVKKTPHLKKLEINLKDTIFISNDVC